MKKTTPISKVMTTQTVALSPSDTMDMAELLFEKHNFHHLPVVENGCLLGIVSYTDLLKITRQIFGDMLENRKNEQIKQSITARQVMEKDVTSLGPEDSLGDALRLFRTNRFHALPVIEGEAKRLVGIITTTDLLHLYETSLAEKPAATLVM